MIILLIVNKTGGMNSISEHMTVCNYHATLQTASQLFSFIICGRLIYILYNVYIYKNYDFIN